MGCQDLQSDVVKIDQPESTDPCSSEHVGSVTPDPAQPHHHHKRLPNPSLSFGSKEEPERQRNYDQWECRVAMAAHTTRGWLALHGDATAGRWLVLTYSFLESCSLIRGSSSLGAAAFPFPPAFTETAAGVVSRGRSAPSEPVVPPVWLHCGTGWPICDLIFAERGGSPVSGAPRGMLVKCAVDSAAGVAQRAALHPMVTPAARPRPIPLKLHPFSDNVGMTP